MPIQLVLETNQVRSCDVKKDISCARGQRERHPFTGIVSNHKLIVGTLRYEKDVQLGKRGDEERGNRGEKGGSSRERRHCTDCDASAPAPLSPSSLPSDPDPLRPASLPSDPPGSGDGLLVLSSKLFACFFWEAQFGQL